MGVLIRDISLGPPGVGGKFNGTILGIRIEKIKLIDLIYTIGAVNQYDARAYPLYGGGTPAFHMRCTVRGLARVSHRPRPSEEWRHGSHTAPADLLRPVPAGRPWQPGAGRDPLLRQPRPTGVAGRE